MYVCMGSSVVCVQTQANFYLLFSCTQSFSDSVLTAEQITRLSATEFRCTLPMMNFFGTKIQPILYVDVIVYPEFNRSEIVVLRAETVGSEVAERANGTFSINAITVVSAGDSCIIHSMSST